MRLSIRWKILGAIAIMGGLMFTASLVSIGAMDYMHTELHSIQELEGSNLATISVAVDKLQQTQHGAFFSFALFSILGTVPSSLPSAWR
jgi:hypothetical protein